MGRAEDHRLRPVGDLPPHVVEVGLVPGERARDDARAREHDRDRVRLEGRLGHDDLVAPLERRERQEPEQLVGAVAEDELLGPDAEPSGEGLAQREGTPVGVEVDARRLARDRGDDAGRGPERVLVGRQADELGKAELGREPLWRRPGLVRDDGIEDVAPDVSHGPILVSLRRI